MLIAHPILGYGRSPRTARRFVFLYAPGGRRLATYKLYTDGEGKLSFTLISSNVYLGKRVVQSNAESIVVDRLNFGAGMGQ
jgi:hypothetical protein